MAEICQMASVGAFDLPTQFGPANKKSTFEQEGKKETSFFPSAFAHVTETFFPWKHSE